MKITFGMIVFNGNYVLEEVLASVYPYAHQILIAEGPVQFWQSTGRVTSSDGTNQIIDNFPDPDNKISITHGLYSEKEEQCNAYIKNLSPDTDYVWNLDSDEVFKPEDIEKVISLLEKERYTTVGFKSCSFYGGFDKILGGFEENAEFNRICKVYPGSTWASHRPPRMKHEVEGLPEKHLDFNELYKEHGVRMYHYSYVFPYQVAQKVAYYKAAVSKDHCIDNYFDEVYLPWVTGDELQKSLVEHKYEGVHEFKPKSRGECKTKDFNGEHPKIIKESMPKLKNRFVEQLSEFVHK